MKYVKIFILLLCVLLLLSSCQYQRRKTYDELGDDITHLEEQYSLLRSENEELRSILNRCSEEFTKIYCYFDDDPDVSYSEALEAVKNIDKLLDPWS